MNERLGMHIKMLRESADISVKQVAYCIGIGEHEYVCIEEGKLNITYEMLSKISTVLNVSIADITIVLDEQGTIRSIEKGDGPLAKIFDMLDLFYVNKRAYDRLHLMN